MTTVRFADGETKTWSGLNRCLCYNCRNLFSSLSAFEKYQKRGNCVDPAKVGLELKDGIWQYPGPAVSLRLTLGGPQTEVTDPNTRDNSVSGPSADVTAKNGGYL